MSDLPKHKLVFRDERYSPKSGMGAYPIALYNFMAGTRRVPVSRTILVTPSRRASRSRAWTSARPMPWPQVRVDVHPLQFGGCRVQPPHRAAADRHVIEIRNQKGAVAGLYLGAGEREMRGTWFGKASKKARCRDGPGPLLNRTEVRDHRLSRPQVAMLGQPHLVIRCEASPPDRLCRHGRQVAH